MEKLSHISVEVYSTWEYEFTDPSHVRMMANEILELRKKIAKLQEILLQEG